jgi:predicted nucleic acid-binding protein
VKEQASSVVVDASVLIDALTTEDHVGDQAREALRGHRLAAPEHLRIEVLHAIRGRLLGGKITDDAAAGAVHDLAVIGLELVPTALLLERIWALRDNLSGFDAAYVAAAEHLGVPLVTSDKRLAAASGVRREVRMP